MRENNEISVKSYDSALLIQKELIDNGYVVMLSREENLWIINYIWDFIHDAADRNAVVFMNREDYEEWESLILEKVIKEKKEGE